jgi:hypothetical protein
MEKINKEIKKCLNCSNDFLAKRNGNFCCPRCRLKYYYENIAKIKRDKIINTQKCLNCGKDFTTKRKSKFCSGGCSNKFYYYNISIHKEKKDIIITSICGYCNKEFTYKVINKHRKYCSKFCRDKKKNSKKILNNVNDINDIKTFNVDKFNKKLNNKIRRNKYLKDEGLL